MKTSIKNKWIDALLSGDYDQIEGQLGEYVDGGKDKFCCLGVLCDVLLDDDKAPVTLEKRMSPAMTFNGSESATLPYELLVWLGIEDHLPGPDYSFDMDPNFERANRYTSPFDDRGSYVDLELISLNDEGFTFEQIADVIRWAEPDE